MTAYRGNSPNFQAFYANGAPLSGGKVFTYASGTTTPLPTFTSSSGGTENANPVTLGTRGEAVIYWSDEFYKITVKDPSGNGIWTVDPYFGGPQEVTRVYIPGKTRPWDAHEESKNPSYDFADDGSTAPIVISLGAATSISITATGSVLGVQMAGADTGPAAICNYLQQLHQPGKFVTPLYTFLLGAFTDSSGNVVQPIAIGNGGKWSIPSGATQLQIGINDGANYYSTYSPYNNNTGGFYVTYALL